MIMAKIIKFFTNLILIIWNLINENSNSQARFFRKYFYILYQITEMNSVHYIRFYRYLCLMFVLYSIRYLILYFMVEKSVHFHLINFNILLIMKLGNEMNIWFSFIFLLGSFLIHFLYFKNNNPATKLIYTIHIAKRTNFFIGSKHSNQQYVNYINRWVFSFKKKFHFLIIFVRKFQLNCNCN